MRGVAWEESHGGGSHGGSREAHLAVGAHRPLHRQGHLARVLAHRDTLVLKREQPHRVFVADRDRARVQYAQHRACRAPSVR
eukprot:6152478-Prymnesium_polylepis.1